MKKIFCVSFTIDYHHRVVVGCHADSEEQAIDQARSAFDNGDIWEDTETMPLLYDDYEEMDGETLQFCAEAVPEMPKPDASVFELKRRAKAFAACRALLAGDPDLALMLASQATTWLAEEWQSQALLGPVIGQRIEPGGNGDDAGLRAALCAGLQPGT